MDDNHRRISELFLAARKQPPEARRGFLERACPDSPEIRSNVENMLERETNPPDFLKTNAMQEGSLAASISTPEQIGPFHIEGVLGEGGMGVVYLAEQQEPVRRKVALKVLRVGLATPKLVARFEAERQLLASFNHPSVAGVHDGGTTEQGLPYLVMEYVDGESITNYCDKNRLTVAQRLELFKQVCSGVQHAHQNAIIHRDLKPTNILIAEIDGTPVPKIIDFGIAKTLSRRPGDSTPTTECGQVVGTPEYMSPEQTWSNGHAVDTRSDVYSLGVVLYELLSGCRPFDSNVAEVGVPEALRQRIRNEDPAPLGRRLAQRKDEARSIAEKRRTEPAGLTAQLRGELEWIVARSLEKEPGRRYGAPSELVADIDRHLNHEAVLAGPPSHLYRLRKVARRHRGSVTAGLTMALLLVGFSTTVAFQNNRVVNERRALEKVTEYLVGMLGSQSATERRLNNLEDYHIVDRARETIGWLDDQPASRARIKHMLGRHYMNLHLYRDARDLLEESHTELAATLGSDHEETLRAQDSLALLYLKNREIDRSYRLRFEVLDRRRKTLGEDHPDTLVSLRWLAKYRFGRGESGEAEAVARALIAGSTRRWGPSHSETLLAESLRAAALIEMGRTDEAESLLVDLQPRMLQVLGERHLETTVTSYNLALAHADRGDRASALEQLRLATERGLHIGQKLEEDPILAAFAGNPEFESISRLYGLNLRNRWPQLEFVASEHRDAGRFVESLEVSLDLFQAKRRVLGKDHINTLIAEYAVIDALAEAGKYTEAEAQGKAFIERLEELMANPPKAFRPREREDAGLHADAQWNLAQEYMRRDAYSLAVPVLESARNTYESDYDPAFVAFADACLFSARGEAKQALDHLEKAAAQGFDIAYWLDGDLALKPLYGHPRFEAAAAEIRKRAAASAP